MSAKYEVEELESIFDQLVETINNFFIADENIDEASARLHSYYCAACGILWSLYAQELITEAKLFQRMQALGARTTKKLFGLIPDAAATNTPKT